MRLPCIIDLSNIGAQEFVQNVIESYGKTKDLNQLALTVFCETENGHSFEIVQFHKNRKLVHFLSGNVT